MHEHRKQAPDWIEPVLLVVGHGDLVHGLAIALVLVLEFLQLRHVLLHLQHVPCHLQRERGHRHYCSQRQQGNRHAVGRHEGVEPGEHRGDDVEQGIKHRRPSSTQPPGVSRSRRNPCRDGWRAPDPTPWNPTDGTGPGGEPSTIPREPGHAAAAPPAHRRSKTERNGTSVAVRREPVGMPVSGGKRAVLQAASSMNVLQQVSQSRSQLGCREALQRREDAQAVLSVPQHHRSIASKLSQCFPHAAPGSVADNRGAHGFRHHEHHARRPGSGTV